MVGSDARRSSLSTLADLPNLGPRTCAWLRDAGFTDADHLLAQDPVAVGRAVRALGHPFQLNGVYALAAAARGCHWQALPDHIRADLARRWQTP
jgi:hypothetical protein